MRAAGLSYLRRVAVPAQPIHSSSSATCMARKARIIMHSTIQANVHICRVEIGVGGDAYA